jgi:hypothetical protein
MSEHVFKLFPSKLYLLLIGTAIFASLLIVLCLSVSFWIKLPGFLLLLIYGVYLFWSRGLLRGKYAVTALDYAGDKRWRIYRENQQVDAELLGDSTVTGWVSVLRFRVRGQRWPVSCVVFKDALLADQYRQLLVVLKNG